MESVQAIKQRFGIYGRSEKLNQSLDTAIRVAATDLTVLINGESGSGKEVFSKVIHSLSPRKHNSFIAVNCGAIPPGTINSELFGHEKGSFTGATADRKGYFETADGGTIFLDEIGEMPQDTQAYLLRILESGEFIRVGSSKVLKTNTRIIAATNVNLLERVRVGRFRDDLYFRLNTIPIKVPSLKERREDIMILFRKFAQDFAEKYRTSPIELDESCQELIKNYSWPGNIRELRNAVEQLSVLSDKKLLNTEDLLKIIPDIYSTSFPAINRIDKSDSGMYEREILYQLLYDMKKDLNQLKNLFIQMVQTNDLQMPPTMENMPAMSVVTDNGMNSSGHWSPGRNLSPEMESSNIQPVILTKKNEDFEPVEVMEEPLSMDHMEKELITKALKKYNGKRKDAAEELGISERTLYRKIKQYDIEL
ncbi:MAG: sigma-54-dependent Fis family transcriptional regulator [Saprospiraceae bacterium]|nr:sigma-54-dependent Fis family transcriptional regulator [Saprospiraceae bacterium]